MDSALTCIFVGAGVVNNTQLWIYTEMSELNQQSDNIINELIKLNVSVYKL
jgi:hypothetical protein